MNTVFHRVSDRGNGLSGPPVLATTMELSPAGGAIYLQRNQYVSMHDAAGWTVKALNGTLWITQDGDRRDIVLETGQSFILDRNGLALLTPIGKANFCVVHEWSPQTCRGRAEEEKSRSVFSSSDALFS